jgi:hypothetical protein
VRPHRHAAADDEDVRVDDDGLPAAEETHQTTPSLELIRPQGGQSARDLERIGLVRELLARESRRRGGAYLGGPLIDPQAWCGSGHRNSSRGRRGT